MHARVFVKKPIPAVMNRANRTTIRCILPVCVGAGQFYLGTMCGHMTKAWRLQQAAVIYKVVAAVDARH